MLSELPDPSTNSAAAIVARKMFLLFAAVCLSASIDAFGQTDPVRFSPVSPVSQSDVASDASRRGPGRAEVTYSSGLLTVRASNSSLDQILREIAVKTGMKITGGVPEDRVFGNYGPAQPSTVLATLLDGSGSNMLLVQDAARAPKELVLTPRLGGITPPNPNANGAEDSDNEAAAQVIRQYAPQPQPPQNSRAPYRSGTGGMDTNPAATAPSSTSQQIAFPPIDSSTPPATATTTPLTSEPSSPGSVKTPQQIFEQLQKLRQQQNTPPASPPQ